MYLILRATGQSWTSVFQKLMIFLSGFLQTRVLLWKQMPEPERTRKKS